MGKSNKLKKKVNSDLVSKIKNFKNDIRSNNPFFLNFTLSDFFIYEAKLCFIYLKNLIDLNELKPTPQEICLINNKIEEISVEDFDNSNPEKTIEVKSV